MDVEGIFDYFEFVKKYIIKCEDEFGVGVVEDIIDVVYVFMD